MKAKILSKLTKFIVLLVALLIVCSVPVGAYATYTTYIYTIDDWAVESPDAYVPERVITSTEIGLYELDDLAIENPSDIFIDPDGLVYIADQKNNRIVVLEADFTHKLNINSFVNLWGIPDELAQPRGVFANDTEIFIADTEKNRIVVFSKGKDGVHKFGEHLRIVEKPEDTAFGENDVYKPIALVVDKSGRIYVVSSTTNKGIIAMGPTGEFQGFVGAQKSVVDAFTIFWRNFQTKEQRAQSLRAVPTEYNNISIDEDGLIYVTTSSIDPQTQYQAMIDKDKNYSPIKRLNPQGTDVLQRAGKRLPAGELVPFAGRQERGPSKIVDVALGPQGTWSIIDEARQKVYTYNEYGQLLFAFGDEGQFFGTIQSIAGVVYQGDKMILLDKTAAAFTVYKRTEYGDVVISALENQRNRQYDKSVDDWREILKRNNNSDLAYIGIGKSYYRDGDYQKAMAQYKFAIDVEDYSDAFQKYRKLWIENYVIVIPIVLVALIMLISMFMKNASKVNKRDQIRGDRKLKLSSHLLYGFHIIFHPFDGFWDMKHEKRGSVLAATIYLLLACGMYFYKAIGEGFIRNPQGFYSNFIAEAVSIIVPVTLWVISNWCLTTLFDGEGSMKDIYMATCYALIPLIPVVFFCTLATHIVTEPEAALIDMVYSVAFVWVGLLLFFGAMVVHDYSLGKNVLTTLGSLLGMAFIMFIAVLFSSLLLKMVSFVNSILVELSYRF